jgi:Family of unknown function (DUF6317)
MSADDGYRAVLDELAAAASAFSGEGNSLADVAAGLPGSAPDTGDAALNAELEAVLQSIQVLATLLAQRVINHGSKLCAAHETYTRTDQASRHLFDELTW